MKKLALFDFDHTLFRSPHPPKDWGDPYQWWEHPDSLERFVPPTPDHYYWNETVVEQALRSCSDDQVWTAFATGRNNDIFRGRVEELLGQKGLQFNSVDLRPPKTKTIVFKENLLHALIDQLGGVFDLEIWDDRDNYLAQYRESILEQYPQCSVICHHVVTHKTLPWIDRR